MMIGVYSCSDENIGSSLTDTKSEIIEDSSFVMTGVSVENKKLHARTSTQLVGEITCPGYGKLSSDVVCQLMPANRIDTINTKEEWVDSCQLTLSLKTTGGFTGDSLAPMRMNVYELTKQLPESNLQRFQCRWLLRCKQTNRYSIMLTCKFSSVLRIQLHRLCCHLA